MSDSNNGNGAPKDLDVSVKELRNAIDELSSRLEAMDVANPASYCGGYCGHHCGGYCGGYCGHRCGGYCGGYCGHRCGGYCGHRCS
ncbi:MULTISPECIES: hypothetical protein [Sorangium]|uniref:Heterocycloanthracin/sonorensin family bacteriocin n=1 Tax=Sorangium cellulosum TaxID=56 RepID=A0A4P2QYP5_SORCE|nr:MULTISPECIES: hypothetical protein [Sorangium]AUX35406.1 uncharacterized protein SOCE836_075980 [Sorangium cellulosum]WCQ94710.1 hypothetical protein NQZ70_07478 [Sorangium sp. Soce836]